MTPGPMRRHLRRLALAFPLLACAAAFPVLRDAGPVATIEAATLDWRYALRGPRAPDAAMTILAIDDRTVRDHGGWPLSRTDLARAVDLLAAAGARTVAIDLLLAEPGRPPEGDQRLAAALRRAGNAVLTVAFTFEQGIASAQESSVPGARSIAVVRHPGAPEVPRARGALAPVPVLRQAAAALGHGNVRLGADGAVRELYPALALDSQILPGLPVAAVRVFQGLAPDAVGLELPLGLHLGDARRAVDPDGRWTLAFYGPAGSFPTHSMATLLAGELPEKAVRGRMVWIGATATAVGDTFVTPFEPAMPGVEVFATAAANLLNDAFLVRNEWTAAAGMLGILCVGGLTLAMAGVRPPALAVAVVPLPALAWFAVSAVAFTRFGIWLNVTLPLAVAAGAAVIPMAWRAVLSERQRRRLASFVPTRLADALAGADHPAFEGRRQPAAVLFVDLAGFTGRSEAGGTEATVALLRQLHADFEELATAHDGYVDSFSGDGAMLVFGVPQPGPADVTNAADCARALLSRGRAREMALRVGLHYGEVQVARLGGRRQHQLTLAGDPVNLASRLMDVAKANGAALAMSDAVAAALRQQGESARLAGLDFRPGQAIRGRTGRVDVWLAPADMVETPR